MTTLLDAPALSKVVNEPRALLPLFDRGLVPLVVEGGSFLGLITRMDLLTHLRRQLR